MAALRRLKTNIVKVATRLSSSAVGAWAPVLGLILLVVGGLAIQAGALLQLLYPVAALFVGVFLYWRYPVLYLGFAWWLWFLTPEVRRLVDYQQGWNPENPVMLAPLLVTGLSVFALLRYLPSSRIHRSLPWGLTFLGLFYGYSVGVFKVGLLAATFDLLNWAVPVVLAFHLMVHWRSYPCYRRVVQRTFVGGVLVMGLYGLLQYFALPAWDHYWLISAPIDSVSSLNAGNEPSSSSSEPFWLYIFSTLNSPGPFGLVMMAGLLLLLSGGGLPRWLAAAVGYPSFLLAFNRGAWGGWMVGLLFVVAQAGRFRLRLLATVAVMVLSVLPLLIVEPPAGEHLQERFQSFVSVQQDPGVEVRQSEASGYLPLVLLEPAGHGLGSAGTATKLSTAEGELEFATFDNGLLHIPFVLGGAGTLLYGGGLGWLLFRALRGTGLQRSDLFAATSRGIVVAVLAQLFLENTLVGVEGMVFWCFLGLSLAARAYHTHDMKGGEQRDTIEPRV